MVMSGRGQQHNALGIAERAFSTAPENPIQLFMKRCKVIICRVRVDPVGRRGLRSNSLRSCQTCVQLRIGNNSDQNDISNYSTIVSGKMVEPRSVKGKVRTHSATLDKCSESFVCIFCGTGFINKAWLTVHLRFTLMKGDISVQFAARHLLVKVIETNM